MGKPLTEKPACWHQRLGHALDPAQRAALSSNANVIARAGATGQVHLPSGCEDAAPGCLVVEGNRLLASGDTEAAIERYVQPFDLGRPSGVETN